MQYLAPVILVTALALSAGNGLAASFSCPSSVTSGARPMEHGFRFVSFFDGDPKDLVDLAPDESDEPNRIVQTWDLEPSPGSAITVVCRYKDTDATMTMTLPDGITRCTLVTPKDPTAGDAVLTCE